MRQVSKLEKAKAAIVLDQPFFSSILFKHPLTADKSIPTLVVNARGDIRYNPDFIESLTVPQVVWALCHEVGHVIGKHALRRGQRDHKRWNYAGDAWINDMLTNAGVGQPIDGTVNMPGSKDKTTESIYDSLPEIDGSGGGGGGQRGNDWDNGLGDDIQDDPSLTESEKQQIEAEIKIQIAQAAQAAKMRGKLGGHLANVVNDILNVKTPWYDILERYMVRLATQEQSWKRPNRRFIGNGVYLPSWAKQPAMGPLAVQVDVSGSISQQEVAYYNGHLSRIITQVRPESVHVLLTDTEVKRYSVFQQDEEVSIQHFSGGGTHMPAGFDFLAEQGVEPELFICLTDGYTGFGEPPDYPVIWCISSDIAAPYGENVHFEMS
jgi:predicted metal-dependent peptidase